MGQFARVAVKGIPYAADRPYDYRIPDGLRVLPGMRILVPFGRGNRQTEGFVLQLTGQCDAKQVKTILSCHDDEPVLEEPQIKLAIWMRERFFCPSYDALRSMLPAGLWYEWEEKVSLAAGVTRENAFETVEGDAETLLLALFAAEKPVSLEDCESALGKDPKAALKTLREKGLCRYESIPRRKTGDKTELRAELAVSTDEAALRLGGRFAPAQREVVKLLCDVGSALARDILYLTGTGAGTLRALEKKGLITLTPIPVYRTPKKVREKIPDPIALNQAQQSAFETVMERLSAKKPSCGLLYGVTGSGKTSVYIRLTEETLKMGGGVMILVPEIALTPQLLSLFAGYFGSRVAVLHSALSMGERLDEWKRIRKGLCDVVLGTRSAVFAPLRNLRLIIIDEEQEQSYKSENTPRYHAPDVAKYRSVQTGAVLLLGSATPSVESYQNALDGAYFLCRLPGRFNGQVLPKVKIVSLRDELSLGNDKTISAALHTEISRNLERGEQSILLLNRRGHHKRMLCPDCGSSVECPRCSVPLSYHSANKRMMCHYCGYSCKWQPECPECGAFFRPLGSGTQRVVEELSNLFPGMEVLRMDADTTAGKGGHEKLLERFRKHRVPVMVGTQMVAKGLDFENVTLVGVLDADSALYMDDFRAHEHAFDLITQVVGRAGRGALAGRALIQTFNPDHPVILAAAKQDYEGFFEEESALRRLLGFPPFAALCRIVLFGLEQDDVLRAGIRVREWAEQAACPGVTRVMGPAQAPVLRLNLRYRYHILLFGEGGGAFRRLISNILSAFPGDKRNRKVGIYADYNPIHN